MENAPEKTASGLLLPEEARDKMNVGRVALAHIQDVVRAGAGVVLHAFGDERDGLVVIARSTRSQVQWHNALKEVLLGSSGTGPVNGTQLFGKGR